ncbi:MAG: hypothetical protein WAK93_03795, partial [Solirubrobacteraceae bacterium]
MLTAKIVAGTLAATLAAGAGIQRLASSSQHSSEAAELVRAPQAEYVSASLAGVPAWVQQWTTAPPERLHRGVRGDEARRSASRPRGGARPHHAARNAHAVSSHRAVLVAATGSSGSEKSTKHAAASKSPTHGAQPVSAHPGSAPSTSG